jgi:hypothetical protein
MKNALNFIHLRDGKLSGSIITLGFLVTCLVFLMGNTQSAGLDLIWGQSKKKVITQTTWRTEPPVKFVHLRTAGKEVEFEKEFDGDDDEWTRGLGITLENTSKRNIIYINVSLIFPETKAASSEGYPMASALEYGKYPRTPSHGNYDTLLRPGEKVDLELSDSRHSDLRSFLQHYNFSKVNALHIHLNQVIYDDDTMWMGDILFRRDPSNPNSWNRIQ